MFQKAVDKIKNYCEDVNTKVDESCELILRKLRIRYMVKPWQNFSLTTLEYNPPPDYNILISPRPT